MDVEEPVVCDRIFALYAEARGCRRGSRIEEALARALTGLEQQGTVQVAPPFVGENATDRVVRSTHAPPVLVRTRGPRDFAHIPLSEIASVMKQILTVTPDLDDDTLFRWVCEKYDIGRLGRRIRKTLADVRGQLVL